jgi:hypothetical protein
MSTTFYPHSTKLIQMGVLKELMTPDLKERKRVLSALNMSGTPQLFCLTMGNNCTIAISHVDHLVK